jgi:hypothetical protein
VIAYKKRVLASCKDPLYAVSRRIGDAGYSGGYGRLKGASTMTKATKRDARGTSRLRQSGPRSTLRELRQTEARELRIHELKRDTRILRMLIQCEDVQREDVEEIAQRIESEVRELL